MATNRQDLIDVLADAWTVVNRLRMGESKAAIERTFTTGGPSTGLEELQERLGTWENVIRSGAQIEGDALGS